MEKNEALAMIRRYGAAIKTGDAPEAAIAGLALVEALSAGKTTVNREMRAAPVGTLFVGGSCHGELHELPSDDVCVWEVVTTPTIRVVDGEPELPDVDEFLDQMTAETYVARRVAVPMPDSVLVATITVFVVDSMRLDRHAMPVVHAMARALGLV